MRYFLWAASLCLLLLGCSRPTDPLTSHGKPVAHWLEELKQPDAKARKKAVVALGAVGKADPAAIPALIAVVKDDRDGRVRNEAVVALLNIGPDAEDAIPASLKPNTTKIPRFAPTPPRRLNESGEPGSNPIRTGRGRSRDRVLKAAFLIQGDMDGGNRLSSGHARQELRGHLRQQRAASGCDRRCGRRSPLPCSGPAMRRPAPSS